MKDCEVHDWHGVWATLSDGSELLKCSVCRGIGKRAKAEETVRFWMSKKDYWDRGGIHSLLAGKL